MTAGSGAVPSGRLDRYKLWARNSTSIPPKMAAPTNRHTCGDRLATACGTCLGIHSTPPCSTSPSNSPIRYLPVGLPARARPPRRRGRGHVGLRRAQQTRSPKLPRGIALLKSGGEARLDRSSTLQVPRHVQRHSRVELRHGLPPTSPCLRPSREFVPCVSGSVMLPCHWCPLANCRRCRTRAGLVSFRPRRVFHAGCITLTAWT